MKLQRAKIRRIIERGATGRYCLLRAGGDSCVLGTLLLAAGVPADRLIDKTEPSSVLFEAETGSDILRKVYGIQDPLLRTLIRVNDAHWGTAARRAALIRVVSE